jgi:hypothetical protein
MGTKRTDRKGRTPVAASRRDLDAAIALTRFGLGVGGCEIAMRLSRYS